MKKIILSTVFIVFITIGCKTNSVTLNDKDTQTINNIPKREHSVQALLWQQQSAEYRALCHQAYNIARLRLDNLLKKQHEKPIAIVTDIDETVLDNSPYNARMVKDDSDYTGKTWVAWGEETIARPVPGALEFFNYAHSKGVTIIYLSNRYQEQKQVTIENLKKEGFPAVIYDNVLLKQETSGKENRRNHVEKTHKIVMLLGDNLSDFSNVFDKQSTQKRNSLVTKKQEKFGNKFIVFPNPMYGDWETKGIYEGSYKWTEKQKDSIRKAKLRLN